MSLRAESSLISVIILTGSAVVLSIVIMGYTMSLINQHRSQVDLSNYLYEENSNTLINVISFDNASSTLWILLRRLDGLNKSYFIMVDTGNGYLSCRNISTYIPSMDIDGVLCNSNDCTESSIYYQGPMKEVYIPWEGVISDFESYARSMGFTRSSVIQICRVVNTCGFSGSIGRCDGNTIVKMSIPREASIVRVFLVAVYENRPYVISVYEVLLR